MYFVPPSMSASGYERKFSTMTGMSAFHPKADIPGDSDVRL